MQEQQQSQPSMKSPNKYSQMPTSMNIPLDIVGGTAFGRYQKISNESTYNMIISDNTLVPFAGHKLVVQIAPGSQSRNVFNSILANSLIAVVGDGIFTISSNFVVTSIGSTQTFTGNVFIADNLAGQIAIVDGTNNIYIYNFNLNTFQTILVDFAAVYITYQDTFFIASDGNSNAWRLSQPNDGTSWPADAQHVGALQTKASLSKAVIALDRILLVMSQTVTEPWYDAGLQLFPYARNNYYCIDYGILSTNTLASGYGMIVWLGSNQQSGFRIIVSQEGGQPNPVSTDGLDYLIANFINPQDCYGMLYQLEGHVIYQITWPTDNYTFIYDFNTSKLFSLSDENLNHHIARRVVFFNGQNYFISLNDANLYLMNSSINTYNGESIPRIRIGKNIRLPGGDKFVVQNINVTMESGQNVSGAVKQTPMSMVNDDFLGQNRIDFNVSNDGGYRWGYTWSKQLPNLGKFSNQCNFWNVGSYNDLVWKLRFVSQGRFVATGGTISLYT